LACGFISPQSFSIWNKTSMRLCHYLL